MNSTQGALLGQQTPRVRSRPPAAVDFEDGLEAVELAQGYGLTADEWQDAVVTGWLARRPDGRLAAGRCGLAVPRQNGKNGGVEVAQLHKMVMQGRKILHTAHEVKTARKAFTRLISFFENERKHPELAALVKEIRRTNGQEAIVLTNGASCEFVARSRGSGRGYTVDDLFCDEAQELTDEQLEALLPTISAAPSGDPQMIFLGTPPGPNSQGDVFARVRAEGVLGKDARLAWDEWSISDDLDPAVAVRRWRELSYATNPALGRRLNITTVEDESRAMSASGFARERLGQWSSLSARLERALPRPSWSDLKILPRFVPESGRRVFGVKFSVDGASVGLAGAIRPQEGPIHVDGIRMQSMGEGIQTLVDWLLERHESVAQIVVDGKAGAGYLIGALRDGGVRNKRVIITPTLEQVLSAHSMFEQGVKAGDMTLIDQPLLDAQAVDAVKRPIGKSGGFGWAPGEGDSVVLLDAATLAYWGAKTTKRDPSRKQVVGV